MRTRSTWAVVIAALAVSGSARAEDDPEASVGEEVIEVWDEAPLEVDAPGVTEVDRDELATAAGARGGDAIAALRNLPGIASVSASSGVGDLIIRGTGAEDSLFLIDGVEMPLVMHFGDALSILPTEMIESIELSPGGFDVEYGRATGGIVHVKTRLTPVERPTGFAEVSFINAAAFVQTPVPGVEGLSVAASVRRSLIDQIVPAMIPDDFDLRFNVPPYYYDGQLRVDWLASPRHSVSVLAMTTTDRMELDVDEENPSDRVINGTIGAEDAMWRVLARWTYRAGDLESNAIASYGRVKRMQYVNDEFFYLLEPEIATAREDLRYRAAGWMTVRAGAEAQLERGRQSGVTILPASEGMAGEESFEADPVVEFDEAIDDDVFGVWLAADVRPVPELTLTPGLRLDHYAHIDATTMSPRLASAYRLGKVVGRVALGAYSRPLALAEAVPSDLSPERGIHYVAGIERPLGQGAKVSLAGFYTALRDLVVRDPSIETDNAFDQYVNRGTGTTYGLEAVVRLRRERLRGWLSYTLSRSTRRDGEGMEERLFDQDQTHNLVAVASYQRGPWGVSGRFRLATGTPYTPVVGAIYVADADRYEPMHGAYNSERYSLAHQLDLRVDRWFELGEWRLSMFLDLTNVYAHAAVIGHEHNFDYTESQLITDIPFLPAIGVRGTL